MYQNTKVQAHELLHVFRATSGLKTSKNTFQRRRVSLDFTTVIYIYIYDTATFLCLNLFYRGGQNATPCTLQHLSFEVIVV
jgi:hypothetical protein